MAASKHAHDRDLGQQEEGQGGRERKGKEEDRKKEKGSLGFAFIILISKGDNSFTSFLFSNR